MFIGEETEIHLRKFVLTQNKRPLMLKLANNFHARYEEATVNSGGGWCMGIQGGSMSDKNNGSQKCSELAGSGSGELINKRYWPGVLRTGTRGEEGGGRKGGQLFSDRTTCFLCHRIHYLRRIHASVRMCLHCARCTMLILFRLARFRLTQARDRRRRSTSVFFHW